VECSFAITDDDETDMLQAEDVLWLSTQPSTRGKEEDDSHVTLGKDATSSLMNTGKAGSLFVCSQCSFQWMPKDPLRHFWYSTRTKIGEPKYEVNSIVNVCGH